MNNIELYEDIKLLEHRFNQLEDHLDKMDKYRFTRTRESIISYEENRQNTLFKRKVIHQIIDDMIKELRSDNENKAS